MNRVDRECGRDLAAFVAAHAVGDHEQAEVGPRAHGVFVVGAATRDLFASWFPRVFTPFVRYSIYAMLDDAMISSFGFPKPLPLTRPLLRGLLKLRDRSSALR